MMSIGNDVRCSIKIHWTWYITSGLCWLCKKSKRKVAIVHPEPSSPTLLQLCSWTTWNVRSREDDMPMFVLFWWFLKYQKWTVYVHGRSFFLDNYIWIDVETPYLQMTLFITLYLLVIMTKLYLFPLLVERGPIMSQVIFSKGYIATTEINGDFGELDICHLWHTVHSWIYLMTSLAYPAQQTWFWISPMSSSTVSVLICHLLDEMPFNKGMVELPLVL